MTADPSTVPPAAPSATDRTGPAALPAFDGAVPLVEQPRTAFVAQIMGLPMSVHVRGPLAAGPRVAQAVEAAFEALRADDATFSTWKPESPVSRIRRGETTVAEAGERVALVARLCEEAAGRTGGVFSAWLPDAEGVVRFDPTGLVKGWAVEQAFDALVASLAGLGPHDVLLSAGGDVVVHCARTDTPDWRIAVEDPRDRSRVLLTVPLRRGAVATSGTAARGTHIVDPRTGGAATALLSATVVGPSLTWADVYATAAFVRGGQAADWLRGLDDHAGVLVGPDGTVTTVSSQQG